MGWNPISAAGELVGSVVGGVSKGIAKGADLKNDFDPKAKTIRSDKAGYMKNAKDKRRFDDMERGFLESQQRMRDERERLRGREAPEVKKMLRGHVSEVRHLQDIKNAQTTAAEQAATRDAQAARVASVAGPQAARLGQASLVGQGPDIQAARLGQASQIGGPNISQTNAAGQNMLAGHLQGALAGQNPSIAQLQLQEQSEQNRANIASSLASQRGGGSAAALRGGMDAMAREGQALNRSAALLRAQEQAQAAGQLGSVYAAGRQQDLAAAQLGMQGQQFNAQAANQFAMQQAGYTQQANMRNAELGLQSRMADASSQNQFMLQQAGYNQQANMMGAGMAQERALAQAGYDQQANLSNADAYNVAARQRAGFVQSANSQNASQQFQANVRNAELEQSVRLANQAAHSEANRQQTAFEHQANMANANMDYGLMQQDAQLGYNYSGMDFGTQQAIAGVTGTQMDRELAIEQFNANQAWAAEAAKAGIASQNTQIQGNIVGGVLSGIAGATAAMAGKPPAPPLPQTSDIRAKENIKEDPSDIKSFLDSVNSYKYNYKWDPEDKGSYSVMAQELEKTPVGKSMVVETPEGVKMVDYGKGFGVILAAQAQLNKRLKSLEKPKKEKGS